MRAFDPRNLSVTFGEYVLPAGELPDFGITTGTVKVVMKKRRRAVRQKFLAAEAKKRGTTIREVKKLWGNGSSLTIPDCKITVERDSLGCKEWHFEAPGVVGVAVQRAEDGR